MQLQLQCLIHCAEPLDLVCLNGNCEQRGLLCYLCKMESHVNHEPIALKLFLSSFRQSSGGKEYFVKEAAQIDHELLTIHHKLQGMRKRILNMGIIQDTYEQFWRAVVSEVQQFDKILAELELVLSEDGTEKIKQLNKWICKNASKYVKQEQKQDQPKEFLFNAYLKNRLIWLKQIQTSIANIDKKGQFNDEELLSLFVVQQVDGRFNLHFSEQLKGTCMSVLSPVRASMTSSGEQRMMLLEPHLGINRSVKKWRVKIQKLASWIGVGVAHLDNIKSVNFNFSYTSPNHGNYLVSMNGYSWNGYKMQYNSKHQTFQFTTGDIIAVTYDPNANKVSFQKENEETIHTYDVDPAQKPIHAAINMGGIGDCVQILF